MPTRQNQYFLPGEGIRREVITADICRYLGNDALVKPGRYEGRDGFWVTAYRALTSDMISDLKADSLRWAAEQAQVDPRGAVPYRDSRTHELRQQHGPTSAQAYQGQPPASAQSRMDSYSAPAPGYYDAPHAGSGYTPQGAGSQYAAGSSYAAPGPYGNPEYPSGMSQDYAPYSQGSSYNPGPAQFGTGSNYATPSGPPRTMPQYSTAQYSSGAPAPTYTEGTAGENTFPSSSNAQSYSHPPNSGMPRGQPSQQHNARGSDSYGRGPSYQ